MDLWQIWNTKHLMTLWSNVPQNIIQNVLLYIKSFFFMNLLREIKHIHLHIPCWSYCIKMYDICDAGFHIDAGFFLPGYPISPLPFPIYLFPNSNTLNVDNTRNMVWAPVTRRKDRMIFQHKIFPSDSTFLTLFH